MDTLSVRMCVFCASNVKFVNRPLPSFLSFASAETNLCVKPVKPFILKFVPLQVQINLFSWERFRTLPRFETEAEGKSEWPVHVGSFCRIFMKMTTHFKRSLQDTPRPCNDHLHWVSTEAYHLEAFNFPYTFETMLRIIPDQ